MCLHRVEKVTPHTRPQCQVLSLCRMMSLMLLMLTGYLRVVRASTRQASVNSSSTSRVTRMSSVRLLKRGPRSRGDRLRLRVGDHLS